MGTYFIKTFGCQMNHSDSERIASFFEQNDFRASQTMEEASVVVFNTCGIRQAAENRAYSIINNLRKQKGSAVSMIMTGCLAHRKDVQKRMEKAVNLFFSISDFEIFENWILENCLEIGNLPADKQDWKLEIAARKNSSIQEKISYLSIAPKHANNFQAYVPIMTGCNNFCSYCTVPFARGREVSRPVNEIISEIKQLAAQGYKHITLLGQNVNSYRGAISNQQPVTSKKSKKTSYQLQVTSYLNFSQLLRKINAIPGKFWISFVSSHPKDMSDELIETIAKCKKVCEWIHLPLQAGDDEIIRKMNRKYTQKHYLRLIKKIRQSFKKYKSNSPFSLSSDIIVGFPGETKKQFLQSAYVMEKAKFDMVFFGQFSPRPETAAWKMKDNVSNKEKERRESFLNEILKKTSYSNNKKYKGKILEVLIEKEKDGFYFGKTRTQKNVKVPIENKKGLVGKFTKVLIMKANIWNLEGGAI